MTHFVGIDAEQLLREHSLFQAVMIIETCLGSPADMKGAVHVAAAPGIKYIQTLPATSLTFLGVFQDSLLLLGPICFLAVISSKTATMK